MSDDLPQPEAQQPKREPTWLKRLWLRFWAWFTAPVPFPRDHWYQQSPGEGDQSPPESRAEDPRDKRPPPAL